MTDRPTCATCPYWSILYEGEHEEMPENPSLGLCKRYPPTIPDDSGNAANPDNHIATESDGYCGEHPAMAEWIAAQKEPDILDSDVMVIPWSVRTKRAFITEGITTIRELSKKTESELMRYRNFGQTSLNEVIRKLGAHGVNLRGDFKRWD